MTKTLQQWHTWLAVTQQSDDVLCQQRLSAQCRATPALEQLQCQHPCLAARDLLRHSHPTPPPLVAWVPSTRRSTQCHRHHHHIPYSVSKVLPTEPQDPQGSGDLSFLSVQPDTSLHCKTMYTGLVSAVCLFSLHLSLVLTAPTHRGMARLSWPGWLPTGYIPRCSPIQVLTGPGIE